MIKKPILLVRYFDKPEPFGWFYGTFTALTTLSPLIQSNTVTTLLGFPGGASSKESACQCRQLQEMQVQSLGGEDPLEEEMVPHSGILAWKMLCRGV